MKTEVAVRVLGPLGTWNRRPGHSQSFWKREGDSAPHRSLTSSLFELALLPARGKAEENSASGHVHSGSFQRVKDSYQELTKQR